MNPITLLILEAFVRHGPTVANTVVEFIDRKDIPTKEEFKALFAAAEGPAYDEGKAQARAVAEARRAVAAFEAKHPN